MKLREGTHLDLEQYYVVLEADFDSKELINKIALHKALLLNNAELIIFYDEKDNKDVAYAVVVTKNMYKYVLVKYFGVMPWCRDSGIGKKAFAMLLERYKDYYGAVIEIPEFEDNDIEQLKGLYRFFADLGFVKIKGGYYISSVPAKIMVKPLKGPADISPVYKSMMDDFYSRIIRNKNEMIKYWE